MIATAALTTDGILQVQSVLCCGLPVGAHCAGLNCRSSKHFFTSSACRGTTCCCHVPVLVQAVWRGFIQQGSQVSQGSTPSL